MERSAGVRPVIAIRDRHPAPEGTDIPVDVGGDLAVIGQMHRALPAMILGPFGRVQPGPARWIGDAVDLSMQRAARIGYGRWIRAQVEETPAGGGPPEKRGALPERPVQREAAHQRPV